MLDNIICEWGNTQYTEDSIRSLDLYTKDGVLGLIDLSTLLSVSNAKSLESNDYGVLTVKVCSKVDMSIKYINDLIENKKR